MKAQLRTLSGIAVAALLLLHAGAASAASESKDKGTAQGGPAGGGAAPPGAGAVQPRDTVSGRVVPERDPDVKPWEIGLAYEYHHLLVQNDLEGAAVNRNVNVIDATAEWDVTRNDRLRLRAFMYERFIADSGETGLRMDDLILQYSKYIHLPYDMTLIPGAWVTAPISFASQKASSITSPRVSVGLDKGLGKWVHVTPRLVGDYYWVKYNAYQDGADPNVKWHLGIGASAEAQMPFRPQLSFGVDMSTSYYWYYQAGSPTAGVGNQFYGTVQDSLETQPIQQTYGFEVYARYDLSEYQPPTPQPVHWDVTVSFANGDPAVGSPSVIHDGTRDVYLAFRQDAEVYGVVSARY